MSSIRPELQTYLESKIEEHNLESVKDLIIQHCEECIAVQSEGPDDYSQSGNSRFGGDPDLPVDFAWPRETDWEGKERALNFICQINFAELPTLHGDAQLPDKGLFSL